MTTSNIALYRVLVGLGVDDKLAEEAAVLDAAGLATKADVAELRVATKADLADLKSSLIMWMIGVMIAQAGLVLAIVRLVVR